MQVHASDFAECWAAKDGIIFGMKILVVVGARPNFMKAAPILKAIAGFNGMLGEWSEGIRPVLVHTGQHYDARMSDAFFSDLEMSQPDVFLGAGSGSHAQQTAEIMKRFEPVLLQEKPDVLLIVGDVNSTLACALVASKLPTASRPAIVHVEAGLRSFDRAMPEEINRILTDQLSDLLFVTEESGVRNLRAEGVPAQKIYLVGNAMIDSLREYEACAERSSVLQRLDVSRQNYALLTLHRPANVDEHDALVEIFEGLSDLAKAMPVVFPAHPRTHAKIRELGLDAYGGGLRILEPLGYLDFLCLMKNARIVVTDSGGVQEETTALGIPCVTVRDNTERPATIDTGTNLLGGTRRESISRAIRTQLAFKGKRSIPELWDGRAAARIVGILADRFVRPSSVPTTAASGQIVENAR